jgi:LPS O-antigen subunit length determinant protein (WzzB/FepE family)
MMVDNKAGRRGTSKTAHEPNAQSAEASTRSESAEPGSATFANYLQILWAGRRFLATAIIAGLIAGSLAGFGLKTSYVSRFEIKRTSPENYGSLLAAASGQQQSTDITKDAGHQIIYSSLSQAIYNAEIFSDVYKQIFPAFSSKNYQDLFRDIIIYRETTAPRGQENNFIPGFSVDVKSHDEITARKFAIEYSKKIKETATSLVIVEIRNIIEESRKLNKMNIDIARSKHKLNSGINAKELEDAASIAKVGGITKPQISSDLQLSAQIPLESAVPRYFFGSEILQREKEITQANAQIEEMIPGYADMISTDNRLKSLSELLSTTKVKFLDVVVFPKLEKRNGPTIRAALALLISLLFFAAAVLWLFLRRFIQTPNS